MATRKLLMMVARRQSLRRPVWIIAVVSVLCLFVTAAYVSTTPGICFFFPYYQGCRSYDLSPIESSRVLTDAEIESRVVIKDLLRFHPAGTKTPKVAFLFLTPGSLPFEKLWHLFFKGHEGKFSVYVHASRERPVHVSRYFAGRDIRSEPVGWGKISMVEAERRLLANALLDPDNHHFVLLSESCVPVRPFEFVYNYLLFSNVSFLECYTDPGVHGNGRYIHYMLPEVEERDFRKGSQWFTMKRQHALIIMADSLYFTKFKDHCRPNMEGGRNCYADEHYLPTFFNLLDPGGISNWSVTYVDWSEGKWHPRTFTAMEITHELLKTLTSIDECPHITSDEQRTVLYAPCTLKGSKRPCYLFARKFFPETLDRLTRLFSNYSNT